MLVWKTHTQVLGIWYLVFGIERHGIHRKGLQEYLIKKNDAGVGLVDWQTGLQSMVGADWLLLASLSC